MWARKIEINVVILHDICVWMMQLNHIIRMMKLRTLFMTALMLTGIGAVVAQNAMQMPPIPVDPDYRIGKLDNGLTYYIRHNAWPEQRAEFYIAQRVGSIQEDDNQRGLAHFLEHMAFGAIMVQYSKVIPGSGRKNHPQSL